MILTHHLKGNVNLFAMVDSVGAHVKNQHKHIQKLRCRSWNSENLNCFRNFTKSFKCDKPISRVVARMLNIYAEFHFSSICHCLFTVPDSVDYGEWKKLKNSCCDLHPIICDISFSKQTHIDAQICKKYIYDLNDKFFSTV